MRYSFLLIIILVAGFAACKKDKFTTAPQITYKSVQNNYISANIPIGPPNGQQPPIMTIHVTDAEGDIAAWDKSIVSRTASPTLAPGKPACFFKFLLDSFAKETLI